MGDVIVNVGVSNSNGGPVQFVEMLVDTGATHAVFPARLLHRLGVASKDTVEFVLANGEVEAYPVGEANLTIQGVTKTNSVVFGKGADSLLGVVPLQNAGFIPDTTNHQLIPARPRL